MTARRTFGALIAHESVTLVEYHAEHTGLRVVGEWTDSSRASSLDQALDHLNTLIAGAGAGGTTVSIAIEQFGAFHHHMTLPVADDAVVRPIVQREVQRVFGLVDPIVAFARTAGAERAAPGQVFIAGAPRETMQSIAARVQTKRVRVTVATVVTRAMHALYEANGGSFEPTAVLACLESGPHLAFFLEGKLELAIDPPIALETDRPSVSVILDQVERGAVYFRQQFRGASATRVLLSARRDDYHALAAALEQRLRVRVKPLFAGVNSPEAVIAMGAVLESHHPSPLDLFPHPPTAVARARAALRGPNRFVAAAATVAAASALWAGAQFGALSAARRDDARLRETLRVALPAIEPMRRVAERRGDIVKQATFVRDARNERATVTSTLAAMASATSEAVKFDSLLVARGASGWTGTLVGRVTGATTASAVRELDTFFSRVRLQGAVTNAALDDFDYPSPAAADSTRRVGTTSIVFRMSFGIGASPAAVVQAPGGTR